MSHIDEQIKTQEEKLKKLKAFKQKQEAIKRAREATEYRANDTRRKILLGALMLDQMEKNEGTKASVMGKLDVFLKRQDDRALFGIEPLKITLTTSTQSTN